MKAIYGITCKTGDWFSNVPLPDQRPYVPDVSVEGGYFFFKESDAQYICNMLNEKWPNGLWKVAEIS